MQKRFFTKGTKRGLRISQLAKIPPLYHGWDPRIKKRAKYLSCLEGKSGFKDINRIAQNAALFVSLS